MKLVRKSYIIKREHEDEGTIYLDYFEMGQFGSRITFTKKKSMAITFLTYYEAAATMCFLVEQLDANLQEELSVVPLVEL